MLCVNKFDFCKNLHYLYRKIKDMKENIGYVYFFRHIGQSSVKIGMTDTESVSSRFNSFRTYAPHGAEILGIIETKNPREVEQRIHKTFKDRRLNGEFFEIDTKIIESLILKYSKKRSENISILCEKIKALSTEYNFERVNSVLSQLLSELNSNTSTNLSDDILSFIKITFTKDVNYFLLKDIKFVFPDIHVRIIKNVLNANFEKSPVMRRYISAFTGEEIVGMPYIYNK